MTSVSEASQASIISPYVKGVETETFLLLSKISEQKELFKNILKKYNAKRPEDIEKMIEQVGQAGRNVVVVLAGHDHVGIGGDHDLRQRL